MSPLVTPQWLAETQADPRCVVLDASIDFQIPNENEKDRLNKIPGARRFDYDHDFCDPDDPLPHMMPSEARFNRLAQQLGLNQDSMIVVYDNSGTFASPRAWWMLKAMGHQQVFILNGGLTEWKAQGYPVTQEYAQACENGNFDGQLDPHFFVDARYVQSKISDPLSLTVDARSQARFMAQVAEPRPGIRSGHIPGACCVPFAGLMDGHKMKPVSELEPILKQTFIRPAGEYLFSCGSGVTACIVLLAARLCGYDNLAVYDGSWTEWGQRHDLPIEP